MNERPTPETNTAAYSTTYNNGTWTGGKRQVVGSDFARRLERERDEAREALRELSNAFDGPNDDMLAFERVAFERARALLARLDSDAGRKG